MRTVVLDGRSLTSEAVLAVAESRAKVECAPDALERVRLARAAVEGIIARGRWSTASTPVSEPWSTRALIQTTLRRSS